MEHTGLNDGGKCRDQVCGGQDLSIHRFRKGERGVKGKGKKEKKEKKSELHAIYVTIRKNGYCKPKCFASLGHYDVLVTN